MRSYLWSLLIGLVIFLLGIAVFCMETVHFKVEDQLTSDFDLEQEVSVYEIQNDQKIRITNFGTNKNMNLYIDNSLTNEVRVVIVHSDMISIKENYYIDNDGDQKIIMLNIESEFFNVNINHVKQLCNLVISSLNNKTIYNYTLLKYAEVRVFVNENYKENVEFINNYGKVYNPIG